MSVYAFTKRDFVKNTWSIIYDGSNEFAVTSIQMHNRSEQAIQFAIVTSNNINLSDGSNSVYSGNGELDRTNTNSVLYEDTIPANQYAYWDNDSGGKILTPSGMKLAITIGGAANSDLEFTLFGLEL
jgi:hypothetical protein